MTPPSQGAQEPPKDWTCLNCGHAHYFEADEAGFDGGEEIPWGTCKTCDCKEPRYRELQPSGAQEPAIPAPRINNTREPTPEEQAALLKMFEAYQELKRLGWRDAIYCPKDGRMFLSIEAGSTGLHRTNYEGEWPKGTWWIHDGDMWPARPILFKEER